MKLLPDVYHAPASRYIGDTGHEELRIAIWSFPFEVARLKPVRLTCCSNHFGVKDNPWIAVMNKDRRRESQAFNQWEECAWQVMTDSR